LRGGIIIKNETFFALEIIIPVKLITYIDEYYVALCYGVSFLKERDSENVA
jgi:hypothetical protein